MIIQWTLLRLLTLQYFNTSYIMCTMWVLTYLKEPLWVGSFTADCFHVTLCPCDRETSGQLKIPLEPFEHAFKTNCVQVVGNICGKTGEQTNWSFGTRDHLMISEESAWGIIGRDPGTHFLLWCCILSTPFQTAQTYCYSFEGAITMKEAHHSPLVVW